MGVHPRVAKPCKGSVKLCKAVQRTCMDDWRPRKVTYGRAKLLQG